MKITQLVREAYLGHVATDSLPEESACGGGGIQQRAGLGEVIEELSVARSEGGGAGQTEQGQQTEPVGVKMSIF